MSVRRAAQRITSTTVLDGNLYQRRLLYLFTYLSALTSLQILHLALDDLTLLLGLIGAVTAGFVYSYYVTPRFRAITTYSVSVLAIGLSIYYAIQIYLKVAMYGNYLGVLLGILTALLAYKAFSPDDHRFILMVCVVFLLFSSVASYDLKFMLLLPLFLIFSGVSLYIANQVDVTVRVAGTTGARTEGEFRLGWGFILILGRAILGVILLSVVAYVVTPHSTQENRNLMLSRAPSVQDPVEQDFIAPEDVEVETENETAEVGISDDFNLTNGSRLIANSDPALKVKCQWPMYLRAQVFDTFTGTGWIKSPRLDPARSGPDALHVLSRGESSMQPHYEIKYVPLFDFPSFSQAVELQGEHTLFFTPEANTFSTFDVNTTDPGSLSYKYVRQVITLLDDQPPYYFSLYQPVRLENISKRNSTGEELDIPMVDDASCLRPYDLETPHPAGFTYTVYSLEPQPRSQRLSEVYSLGPKEILDRYTQLPEGDWDPEVDGRTFGISEEEYRPVSSWLRNYAGQFSLPSPDMADQGPLSVYEKVLSIYRYLLSDEFTYEHQFKVPTDKAGKKVEITEAFIRETKSGYCRYFASAMAVMCRINGIPARVVTGFSPGTKSFVENAWIYRNSNAHAWVEVYIDGYGWLMFDPTPGSTAGPAGSESGQVFRSIIDFLQDLFIIDPAGTQQMIIGALKDLGQFMLEHWQLSLLGLAVLALLATVVHLLLRLRRRSRYKRFVPRNPVVAAYVELGDALGGLGCRLLPSSTARSFLGGAGEEYPAIAETLQRFLAVYEQAAFSPRDPDAAGLELAREAVGRVKGFVAEQQRTGRQR